MASGAERRSGRHIKRLATGVVAAGEARAPWDKQPWRPRRRPPKRPTGKLASPAARRGAAPTARSLWYGVAGCVAACAAILLTKGDAHALSDSVLGRR